MAHAFALQRPDHADLIEPKPDLGGVGIVDAEIGERLAHVEIGLAGGDDAEARLGRIDDGAVEPIGAGEGERGVETVGVQATLLLERVVGPADVEAALGHLEVVGLGGRDALGPDLDGGGALDGLRDQLDPDPDAGVARERKAQRTEIGDLLHVGRVQHRDHRRHEGVLGLVCAGRGLRGVIVAREREHAAVRRGAGEVRMLQHVARAVDARSLAIPQAEYAVIAGAAEEAGLLAAPHRGGGEVFVDAGQEADMMLIEKACGAPQLLIVGAQGRAAVTGDEPGRVQARRHIAPALRQRDSRQRLDAGDVHAA